MAYAHTTWGELKQDLLDRLGGPGFWTDDTTTYSEAGAYLAEAMRFWGAVSLRWREKFTFPLVQNLHFYDLLTEVAPLGFHVTDQQILGEVQYHLLEPLNLTGWSGSSQFTLTEIVEAIERRRNQFLSETGIIVSLDSLPANSAQVDLSSIDPHVIHLRRLAWKDAASGEYSTVWRDTQYNAQAFSPGYALSPDTPQAYSLALEKPLTVELLPPPNVNGELQIVMVQAGATPDVSVGTHLGVPDSFAWAVKWGVLADLLGKEGKSRDARRAAYCEGRFQEGVELAKDHPMPLWGGVDGKDTFLSSLEDADAFKPGWQNTAANRPTDILFAGWNLLAAHPKPDGNPHNVAVEVVRPAPVPSIDSEQVQMGRDELDVILDYAHHIAAFKQGGAEFEASTRQLDNLIRLAQKYNQKLRAEIFHFGEFHGIADRMEKQAPIHNARVEN